MSRSIFPNELSETFGAVCEDMNLCKSSENQDIVEALIEPESKTEEARYDGPTATQVFLTELRRSEQSEGFFLEIGREIDSDDSSRVNRISCSYPWMIEITKKQPYAISFDSTYKRPYEAKSSFTWALKAFKNMRDVSMIEEACVVSMDYDKEFQMASRKCFSPKVRHQLCRWHVMKNVIYHIKKKWVYNLDGTHIEETVGGSSSSKRDLWQEEEAKRNGFIDPEQLEKLVSSEMITVA